MGRSVFIKKILWQWTLVAIVCVCGAAQDSTITLGLGGSIQGAIDDFDREIDADVRRLPDWGFNYTTYQSETDCLGLCPLTSFDVGD